MERQFDEGRFSASRCIGSCCIASIIGGSCDCRTHVFHVETYPHVNLIKVKRRDSENKQDKVSGKSFVRWDRTTQCRPKICIFR